MKQKYTQSFKIQAVEKALSRDSHTTLRSVAESLGIGFSTLGKWISQAKNQELTTASAKELSSMTQDKRPQDWTLEERLNMVVSCAVLSDDKLSEYCRTQGVYAHHVNQWKLDFSSGKAQENRTIFNAEIKALKQENKSLKKNLNRKDKALAETAALLVLQKKVNGLWGIESEDD